MRAFATTFFGWAFIAACTHTPAAQTGPRETAAPRHAQIFRAMTTTQRSRVADQFRERNGPTWRIGGEEDGHGASDVDRFRGHVRRAFKRDTPKSNASVASTPSEEEVIATAQGFVKKNADLLGIPLKELVDLDTKALPLA